MERTRDRSSHVMTSRKELHTTELRMYYVLERKSEH